MTTMSVMGIGENIQGDNDADIAGYSPRDLRDHVFDKLTQFTGAHIRQKIEGFKVELANAERRGSPIFVSVGENCGPAWRLQEVDAPSIGGGYFDFLVLRPGTLEHLLREDFSHMLMLKNLSIGRWENNDSVYDGHYGIWYHHLFYLPKEKKRDGVRRIDETDIPLLFSAARAQFEYLHEKMRLTLRSPLPKVLVYRAVDGEPLSERRVEVLSSALTDYGARNWTLVVVHSTGEVEPAVASHHRWIAEPEGVRWGEPQDWRQLVADLTPAAPDSGG